VIASRVITYYETTDFLIYLLTIMSYTKWPKNKPLANYKKTLQVELETALMRLKFLVKLNCESSTNIIRWY